MNHNEVVIALPYGVLKLVWENPPQVTDIFDDTALFPVGLPQYHFEYEGRVPKSMAVELARAVAGPQMTVNGMPLAEFLEGVSAY